MIDDLMRRAKADTTEAWARLFDFCYPRVVASIRDGEGVPLCDAEDLASEAFGRLATGGDFLNFPGPDDLVAYLVADARSLARRTR